MDRGACTKEGCFLKAVVPDALGNECSKCNDKQKRIAGKILSNLLQFHRDGYWNEILNKYDPTGEFRRRHEWTEDDDEDPED
ncbi:Chemosensory protein 9 [Gryllus bimaculatus]|nr:Chemosensory protein 9 [Gryllus bimaculatus]